MFDHSKNNLGGEIMSCLKFDDGKKIPLCWSFTTAKLQGLKVVALIE